VDQRSIRPTLRAARSYTLPELHRKGWKVSSSALEVERLLTVQDVQGIIGVSRSEVYDLVRRGLLRKAPLPIARTRFRPSDVEAFVNGEAVAL
jgi:predicted DNA-binding transcriptional regulator AlpA